VAHVDGTPRKERQMQAVMEVFSGDLKYYWMLAVLGSCVFLIQTLLMLIFGHGGDGDVDVGGDFDADSHVDTGFGDFQLFSIRSMIAFITFFGWGGVIYGNGGWPGFIVAFVCGLLMMFITALGIFYLFKLQQSGNIYAADMLGKTASVYLKIPAGRSSTGKVTVYSGAGTREVLAVADIEIPNGASVKLVSQIDQNKFLVEKI
jgi:hypothetical protein